MGLQCFQVNCKYCSQRFGVQAEYGKNVKCLCPFCGKENIVAAPLIAVEQGNPTYNEKSVQIKRSNTFGRRVVVGFLIFIGIIIMLSTILYIVFTGISN